MAAIERITGQKWLSGNHALTIYWPETIKSLQPILAVHGMWSTSQRWENYGKFFSERGFIFLAPDLRLHYSNNYLPEVGRISVYDYINDLEELIANLRNGALAGLSPMAKPVIFGHSFGGLLSQKLAEAGLAEKLVLLNSAPPAGISMPADIFYQLQVLRYFPKLLFRKPFRISDRLGRIYTMNNLPEEIRQMLDKDIVYDSGLAAWEIQFGKIQVDFEKINCPTLIIACEKDRITPWQIALKISQRMRHGDFTFWTYPDFAHMILMEPNWELPAQDILDWLNQTPA